MTFNITNARLIPRRRRWRPGLGFRQELREELPARCAERSADGYFFLTDGATRQQQDVSTGRLFPLGRQKRSASAQVEG